MDGKSVIPASAPALGLGVWLVLALGIGASGGLARLPFPLPLVAFGLTLLAAAVLWQSPGLRAWLLARGPAPLVALHLVRFVGFYFLVLHGQGRLPYAFAVPGGWGDNLVATGALLLLLFARPFRTGGQRTALLAWNVLGLADILFVVSTALRLALADRSMMAELTHLPLSLLPTFVVPLIIVSHLLLFAWLRARAGEPIPENGRAAASGRQPVG